MLNKKRLHLFFLISISGLFAWGVYELFSLRFHRGDIYPPYSSFRKDPLGTGVFYRSLENLDGVAVGRNFERFSRFRPAPASALFVTGASEYVLAFGMLDELGPFVATGGRLVVSVYPEKRNDEKKEPGEAETKKENIEPDEADDADDADDADEIDCTEEEDVPPEIIPRWSVPVEKSLSETAGEEAFLSDAAGDRGLPDSLYWPSDLCFPVDSKEWKPIYVKDGRPVLMERQYGDGTIVLASDSFFLSNEGLSREANAPLLSWLVGKSERVFFDESLRGVRKRLGIAGLALKYRLHGLAAGLLVFAILLVWKLSSKLVPDSAWLSSERSPFGHAGGPAFAFSAEDRERGLASLLQRKIRKKDILRACVNEWKKSFGSDPLRTAHLERIIAGLAAGAPEDDFEIEPATGYHAIRKGLMEDRTEWK